MVRAPASLSLLMERNGPRNRIHYPRARCGHAGALFPLEHARALIHPHWCGAHHDLEATLPSGTRRGYWDELA